MWKENKMKKSIVRSFILALASMFLFSACGDLLEKEAGGNSVWSYEQGNKLKDEIEDNKDGILLADHGQSDYKIVIPVSSTWADRQGADELKIFFERSTGVVLSIVNDASYSFDPSEKVISIGDTKIYRGCGVVSSLDELKEDGFFIKTFGGTVVIKGGGVYGSAYGPYTFLEANLGVKIYANDEFYIPDCASKSVLLKNFDLKASPDFDNRALGLSYNRYPQIYEYRLGLNVDHGKNFVAWCHTHFQLLPPKTYYDAHPDWYSADKSQLCLTNNEMIAELERVIKEKIEASSVEHILFEIGQEDTSTFCSCERCAAEAKAHGGNSGVMMRFINKIADDLNPWMEETYHGTRTAEWIVFSYQKTVDPPTKKNSSGVQVPYDETVIAHDNVGVMLAPLGADWSHSMLDGVHNSKTKNMMEGWGCIQPDFYIYTYNVVFDNQLYFMDSWSYVKESYQMWKQMGATFIFDQSASFINLPFACLSNYVRSRLLWDTTSDVESDINDFIDHYYKAGAPAVKKYFDYMRTHYKLLERKIEEEGGLYKQTSYVRTSGDFYSNTDYWPKDWVLQGLRIFDEALAACETISDPNEKEKAIQRIRVERLSPIFMLMDLYRTTLTDADILNYVNEFLKTCDDNSITYYDEHGASYGRTVRALTNGWLTALNG